MAGRWIEVYFKCRCMRQEATIQIPEREVGEDIDDFMGRVASEIGAAHRKRSPLCLADKMEYAKIPAGEGIGVGTGGRA